MKEREPTGIALEAIDHVVIRANDMGAMQDFYCNVLGCSVERESAEIGLVQLRAGVSLIDLVDVQGEIARKGGSGPGSEGHNMDHFCVRVIDFDANRITAWLESHDVNPGEVVTRNGAEGEGPSIYIDDPEGNMVELKGPPQSARVC